MNRLMARCLQVKHQNIRVRRTIRRVHVNVQTSLETKCTHDTTKSYKLDLKYTDKIICIVQFGLKNIMLFNEMPFAYFDWLQYIHDVIILLEQAVRLLFTSTTNYKR